MIVEVPVSVGSLSEYLSREEEGQVDRIIKANLPYVGEKQYQGGSITLWVKVLDTAWNPLKPIPNPKKNAIKGFLRFRKYLRVNRKESIEALKGPVELLHITPSDEGGPIYYTVDLIKTFNLQELTPKLDRLVGRSGVLRRHPDRCHASSRRRSS